MGHTVLTDINFQSQPFKSTLMGTFSHKLALFNSLLANATGYFQPDSGYTQALTKWNVISGDSDRIATGLTTTINNLTDIKDVGVWLEREKAWGAEQILLTVAGTDKDATKEVARQLGEYWAAEIHKIAIYVLNGVFASALADTHVYDDSSNKISVTGLMGAKGKLGDNAEKLSAIVYNSKVDRDAVLDKITVYEKQTSLESFKSGILGSCLGMTPHVTDLLTATANVYKNYLGMLGSMLFMTRPRPQAKYSNANVIMINAGGLNIDVELARISTTNGGQDALISRISALAHVPGVAWSTGSVASNPTYANLATGSNWTKVQTDDKLIPLIQYKTA